MKVSELSGSQLDYRVAKAEWGDRPAVASFAEFKRTKWLDGPYSPSSDWSIAGPIIEREGINLNQASDGWVASIRRENGHGHHVGDADTPLEAAMRCYVASKFGEEVGE